MPCLRATGTMSRSASRLNRDHSICRHPGQPVDEKLLSAPTEQLRSVAGMRKCRSSSARQTLQFAHHVIWHCQLPHPHPIYRLRCYAWWEDCHWPDGQKESLKRLADAYLDTCNGVHLGRPLHVSGCNLRQADALDFATLHMFLQRKEALLAPASV